MAHELPIESLALYLSLDDSPATWAQKILEEAARPRADTRDEIIASGYEVKEAARKLEMIYLNAGKESQK
ncbi:hypothetical protein [Allobaculum sp. Allo2]|uniref:hypothetical protein n=1 Tax=Allobaculum sp. Allo2 TaxID=2853432 RepID=UPI001F621482|nr:hypothetical protein [Allobaculum sp. Allo2]UNT93780.1 hypothetical protein KWG61_03340 [Allobaculum sp. Allo2]